MKTGGEDGIRDEGMLESALATLLLTFDFNDLYPQLLINSPVFHSDW